MIDRLLDIHLAGEEGDAAAACDPGQMSADENDFLLMGSDSPSVHQIDMLEMKRCQDPFMFTTKCDRKEGVRTDRAAVSVSIKVRREVVEKEAGSNW